MLLHRDRQVILQDQDRIGEVDPVLPEIRLSLVRIPLELHATIVCTLVQTCKWKRNVLELSRGDLRERSDRRSPSARANWFGRCFAHLGADSSF